MDQYLIVVVCAFAVGFLIIPRLIGRRDGSFGSPLFFLFLLECFGFLALLPNYFEVAEQRTFAEVVAAQNLELGVLLLLIFNVFFVLGYVLPHGTVKLSILRVRQVWLGRAVSYSLPVLGAALLYELFSVTGLLSAVAAGDFSGRRSFYIDGEKVALGQYQIGALLVFCFGLWKFIEYLHSGGRKSLYLCIVTFLACQAFFVVMSNRTMIVVTLLSYFYAYLSDEKKFSPKQTVVTVALGVLVLFVLSYVALNRHSEEQRFNISDGITEMSSHLGSGTYFFTIEKASIVTARVPHDTEYKLGATLISPFYFFIPRTLWHGKPDVRFGQMFASEVYGRTSESGVPPTFPVELYWNFGWVALVFGGYLLGFLAGLFWRSVRATKDKMTKSLVASTFFPFFFVLIMINDFASGAITFLIVFILMSMLASSRYESAASGSIRRGSYGW